MRTHIFHIADIHIHAHNYAHIAHAWRELITNIIAHPDYKKTIILAIVGDIFDHKMWLQADDITLFKNMLNDLESNEIRTIMMPGNHDYNINQGGHDCKNTSDKVLAIVRGSNYKFITHCSLSQICLIDNLAFFIHSPIDLGTPRPGPEHAQIKKIAMVHEPLINSKTGSGITFQSQRFAAKDFAPVFDITLLGDIHHPQKLAPNVAYSGSFVQKNRGEGIEHGYFLWDVATCASRFIELPQLSLYLKLSAKNNIEPALPRISGGRELVARSIQLHYQDCDPSWVATFSATVEVTYGRPIDEVFNKNAIQLETNNSIQIVPRSEAAQSEIAAINSQSEDGVREPAAPTVDSTINLESAVASGLTGSPSDQADRVLEIFRAAFTAKTSEYPSVARWKIRHLSWSNALCYGDSNWIDFDSLENMNSIIGSNKIGKSSIIDILILVLYNEVLRGTKKTALNTAARDGHIKCIISIGADTYAIERAWLDANNVVVRLYKNGVNASGADMLKTYEDIERLIGSKRVFLNTALALQQRQFLVDISSKELYELMCRMVDLDRLRAVEDDNKSEIRVAKKVLGSIVAPQIPAIIARRDKINADLSAMRTNLETHLSRLAALRTRQQTIIPDASITIPISLAEISSQVDEIERLGDFTEHAQLAAKRIILTETHAKISTADRQIQIGRDRISALHSSLRAEPAGIEKSMVDAHMSAAENIDISLTMTQFTEATAAVEKYGRDLSENLARREALSQNMNTLSARLSSSPIRNSNTIDADLRELATKEFTVERIILDEIPRLKSLVDSNTATLQSLLVKLRALESNPAASGASSGPMISANQIAAAELTIAAHEKSIIGLESSRTAIARFGSSFKESTGGLFHYADGCAECAYNKNLLAGGSDLTAGVATEINNIDISIKTERAALSALLIRVRTYYSDESKRLAEIIKIDYTKLMEIIKRRDSADANVRKHAQLQDEFKIAQSQEATRAEVASIRAEQETLSQKIDILTRDLSAAKLQRAASQTRIDLFQSLDKMRSAREIFAANDATREQIKMLDVESQTTIAELTGLKKQAADLTKWIQSADAHIAKVARMSELKAMFETAQIAEDARDELADLNKEIVNREAAILDANTKIAEFTHALGIIAAELATAENLIKARDAQASAISDRELLDKIINHKSGIPMDMMRSVCARVQARCNAVFEKIADFSLAIVFDGEVHLNVVTKCADAPGGISVVGGDQSSGYQKFIIDIIMRQALCTLTASGCPSILFIDEGFGSADDKNFAIICSKVLPLLSSSFEKVIVISHLLGIHEYTTGNIAISVAANGKSQIQFGPKSEEILKLRVLDDHAAHKQAIKDEKLLRAAGQKTVAVTEREQKKIDEKTALDTQAATIGDTILTRVDAKNVRCDACEHTYKDSAGFSDKHILTASHQKALRIWLKKQSA